MKPFDLEAAKAGKPIITRDGQEAKFIAHVPDADSDYRVVVSVAGKIFATYEDGVFVSARTPYLNDLFMAPTTVHTWVNIYTQPGGHLISGSTVFSSKEAAARDSAVTIRFSPQLQVRAVEVTWEE